MTDETSIFDTFAVFGWLYDRMGLSHTLPRPLESDYDGADHIVARDSNRIHGSGPGAMDKEQDSQRPEKGREMNQHPTPATSDMERAGWPGRPGCRARPSYRGGPKAMMLITRPDYFDLLSFSLKRACVSARLAIQAGNRIEGINNEFAYI